MDPELDNDADLNEDEDLDLNDDDDSSDEHHDDEDDSRQNRRKNRPSAIRRERAKVRALEQKLNDLTKLIQDKGIGTEPAKKDGNVDVEAIRKQIMEEVTSKVTADANAQILVTEAISALKEAGFAGNARRGVRQLELDGIDVTNGRVDEDALLDAIEELKEESPGLFGRRARTARDTDRDNGRSRRHDDDDDARDSSNRRSRSEGMTRERNGGSNGMDSLERALRNAVGAPRNRG